MISNVTLSETEFEQLDDFLLREDGLADPMDSPKVGRNEPCPWGSGRKHKHCHGAN